MNILSIGECILDEIREHFLLLDFEQVSCLISAIKNADRIYVLGAGRSKLILSTFCMRLNHLGYEAYIVGEIPCPPSDSQSLIISATGSGTTGSIMNILEKQKTLGSHIFLITANASEDFVWLTDSVLHVKAPSSLMHDEKESHQLMKSSFEQVVFLLLESIIAKLAEGIPEADIVARHTNLE